MKLSFAFFQLLAISVVFPCLVKARIGEASSNGARHASPTGASHASPVAPLSTASPTPSTTASPTSSPTAIHTVSQSPTYPGEFNGYDSAPPYGRGASTTVSTDCPALSTVNCAPDGSSNYHQWSNVSYDITTGYFQASLITNSCPAYDGGFDIPRTPHCMAQRIPDLNFDEQKPYQMPLLGDAAWSINGVNVYSPYENGFFDGQLCDGASAHGGMDISVLDAFMTQHCENHEIVQTEMLLDECGAHADPYHYHEDLRCAYDHSIVTHSPLIAVALTGQGVYGKFEKDITPPTDLDECNGHYGPVPGSEQLGTDGSEWVYHYHVSDEFPYTLGCYGPLEETTCAELNSEACSESDPVELEIMLDDVTETIDYRFWCPCQSANEDAWELSKTSDANNRARKDRTRKLRRMRKQEDFSA